MIELKSNKKDYSITLPTSLKEINEDVLKAMTDSLNLAEHYCVIALVHKIKLFNLASAINGKADQQVSVVPIIAKVETSNDVIKGKFKIGYRALITRSSLEMGVHYNSKENNINLIAVNKYIDDDKDLRNSIITGEYFKEEGKSILESRKASPECCFIEFKIVPINAIVGAYPIYDDPIAPFIKSNNNCVN